MISPTSLASIDLSEFAARVGLHNGALCAIVADDAALPALAIELANEIKYIANAPIRAIHVATTANATMQILARSDNAWVILHGFSPSTPQLWAHIDQLRKIIHIHTGAAFFRREDKPFWIGCLPGQSLPLRMEPSREEKELLVLKLKTPTPLVNAAFAQNEAHRASA